MRKKNDNPRQNISVGEAVEGFLHCCKKQRLSIEVLCEYEDALCDFFGCVGTECIEDIVSGSGARMIDSMRIVDVEAYTSEQQGMPVEALNRRVEHLHRFFSYCAKKQDDQ